MAGDRRGDGAGAGSVAALVGLPARAWAMLLRELADLLQAPTSTDAGGPDAVPVAPPERHAELAALLAGPASSVAVGPGRDRVAGLLAADPALRYRLADRLAAAGAEPDTVAMLRDRGASGPDVAGRVDADAGGAAAVAGGAAAEDPGAEDPGAREGSARRDLRAELLAVRRQRDGAEARARAAEERTERAESERAEAVARAEAAEAALAGAEAERTRAVERAERRAVDRGRDLAADLAGERSAREQATRDLERERDATARLRAELDRVRRDLEVARAASAAAAPAAAARRRPVGLPDGIAPDTTEAARHLLGAVDLIVVDGYNLTLRVRPGLDLAAQRSWLLERLRVLAAQGRRVVVVFDGDRRDGSRRRDRGVDVRFSPERRIADDDIEFIAGEAAEGAEPTLVVTDDAGLRRRVIAHDADVVGVLPFTGALG